MKRKSNRERERERWKIWDGNEMDGMEWKKEKMEWNGFGMELRWMEMRWMEWNRRRKRWNGFGMERWKIWVS